MQHKVIWDAGLDLKGGGSSEEMYHPSSTCWRQRVRSMNHGADKQMAARSSKFYGIFLDPFILASIKMSASCSFDWYSHTGNGKDIYA